MRQYVYTIVRVSVYLPGPPCTSPVRQNIRCRPPLAGREGASCDPAGCLGDRGRGWPGLAGRMHEDREGVTGECTGATSIIGAHKFEVKISGNPSYLIP